MNKSFIVLLHQIPATFAAILLDKSLNTRRPAVNLHQELLKPLFELGLPSAELIECIVNLLKVAQKTSGESGGGRRQRDDN